MYLGEHVVNAGQLKDDDYRRRVLDEGAKLLQQAKTDEAEIMAIVEAKMSAAE